MCVSVFLYICLPHSFLLFCFKSNSLKNLVNLMYITSKGNFFFILFPFKLMFSVRSTLLFS